MIKDDCHNIMFDESKIDPNQEYFHYTWKPHGTCSILHFIQGHKKLYINTEHSITTYIVCIQIYWSHNDCTQSL